MKKFILLLTVFLLFGNAISLAQSFRTKALAGMNLAIKDQDNTLSLYDFGNNPAWLNKDETKDWLKIIPAFSGSSGDYRRKYNPAEINSYGLTFDGVKTLGELGTFRGFTSYDIEYFYDVNRSLRRFTYDGDAFFLADTNLGSFRYNGPKVNFAYSLEIFEDFFAGASIQYQLIDGLKDTYSRAQTLIRNVSSRIGLAYQPADNFSIGLLYEPSDLQERIESKSEDLLDVEIFHFRGETYSFRRRGSSVNYKTRKAENIYSGHFNWAPTDNIELAGKGIYNVGNTRILIPFGTIKENEDGYSFFDGIEATLQGRYEPVKDLTIGLSAAIFTNSSWSRHSGRDLLLWEWKVNGFEAGAGIANYILPQLLLGVEYQFQRVESDSSKYIDNRFNKIESNNHLVKAGAEYSIPSTLDIRAGFAYGIQEYDLIYGGKDVKYSAITGGFGIHVFNNAVIDILFEYSILQPDSPGKIKKTNLNSLISLKLFTF